MRHGVAGRPSPRATLLRGSAYGRATPALRLNPAAASILIVADIHPDCRQTPHRDRQHFYSVLFRLLRQEVEARLTAKPVETFHRGKLVATHLRNLRPYRPSTVAEHMPSSHRRYRDWTHERIQRDAATIGDDAAALVGIILRSRPHPEQGFRSYIGILGLRKQVRGGTAGGRLWEGFGTRHAFIRFRRRDPQE